VAPNQFEIAPIYEETIWRDHNLLLLSVMKKLPVGITSAYCAEKPFKASMVPESTTTGLW
jgi:glutamine synthetase type III